jgi:hypothetical protein
LYFILPIGSLQSLKLICIQIGFDFIKGLVNKKPFFFFPTGFGSNPVSSSLTHQSSVHLA